MVEFVEGLLDSRVVEAVQAHLDDCPACNEAMAAFAMVMVDPSEAGDRAAAPALTHTILPRPAKESDPPGSAGSLGSVGSDRIGRGSVVGRYVVLDLIGAGSMGTVYSAYDPELERKIALKALARGADDDSASKARFLREAQALARLSHPNIVTIHDVVTHDGRVLLAMELISGETLSAWLARHPRSWRDIRRIFLDAGHGLAAAHAAGVIHRDFKPENVLVSDDGRAHVSDFGLAHQREVGGVRPAQSDSGDACDGDGDGDDKAGAGQRDRPGSSVVPAATRLTATGTILGTPAYMAPEQLAGQRADERSDQFSFCVSLYEALYGRRPFSGRTIAGLAAEIDAGRISFPVEMRAPARLRRLLQRGLRARADDRYPSMEALLFELSRDLLPRRYQVVAAVALSAIAIAGAWVLGSTGHDRELCRSGEQQVAAMWNAEVQKRVRDRFLSTGKSYADNTAAQVQSRLDQYSQRWAAAHRAACEATHVRRIQSPALLDRRMMCLDRALDQFEALATLLAGEPGSAAIDRAVEATHGLLRLERCADREALLAAVPPVEGHEEKAQLAELGAGLAELKALHDVGNYGEAKARAEALAAAADRLEYPPTRAELGYWRGVLARQSGDAEAAETLLYDALEAASRARDDRRRVAVWAELVTLAATDMGRPKQALTWLHFGQSALASIGPVPEPRLRWLRARATVLSVAGHYDDAGDSLAQALQLVEALHGPDSHQTAEVLNDLGSNLTRRGQAEEGYRVFRRAVDIARRELGAEHPMTGRYWQNAGTAAAILRRLDDARQALEQARAIVEQSMGPEHPKFAIVLDNLGGIVALQGDLDLALALRSRALAIREKVYSPSHLHVGISFNNVGKLLRDLDRHSAARTHFERALAVFHATHGETHPHVAQAVLNLADLDCRSSAVLSADKGYTRAVAIREAVFGRVHVDVASALIQHGTCMMENDRPVRAIPPLRRALAILDEVAPADERRAEIQTLLDAARASTGGKGR
ncbi:MAG: serine/threonine-protein kinase [Proteobacteria bacterium]|nr:serine/threonine-protein kinase [Pseudomonadota bacterium]